MKIEAIRGGLIGTNCYFLTDEETGLSAVIDPGFDSPALEEKIRALGNKSLALCLLTHGHFDHISGVAKVKKLTGAKIYLHEKDALFPSDPSLCMPLGFGADAPEPFAADVLVKDGDTIRLGGLTLRVLHTPGHTAGSVCYLVEDALFAGDTLMRGSAGRADLPTGDYAALLGSLKRLAALPGDYRVFPGHGEATTLGEERRYNPFLKDLSDDFAD